MDRLADIVKAGLGQKKGLAHTDQAFRQKTNRMAYEVTLLYVAIVESITAFSVVSLYSGGGVG